ncbi:hypothetical protein C8R43DRAFT_952571 [Mycena crocata]|nr:hypothetical protein C8R43DRAFT_952571 [Mycena crocata]
MKMSDCSTNQKENKKSEWDGAGGIRVWQKDKVNMEQNGAVGIPCGCVSAEPIRSDGTVRDTPMEFSQQGGAAALHHISRSRERSKFSLFFSQTKQPAGTDRPQLQFPVSLVTSRPPNVILAPRRRRCAAPPSITPYIVFPRAAQNSPLFSERKKAAGRHTPSSSEMRRDCWVAYSRPRRAPALAVKTRHIDFEMSHTTQAAAQHQNSIFGRPANSIPAQLSIVAASPSREHPKYLSRHQNSIFERPANSVVAPLQVRVFRKRQVSVFFFAACGARVRVGIRLDNLKEAQCSTPRRRGRISPRARLRKPSSGHNFTDFSASKIQKFPAGGQHGADSQVFRVRAARSVLARNVLALNGLAGKWRGATKLFLYHLASSPKTTSNGLLNVENERVVPACMTTTLPVLDYNATNSLQTRGMHSDMLNFSAGVPYSIMQPRITTALFSVSFILALAALASSVQAAALPHGLSFHHDESGFRDTLYLQSYLGRMFDEEDYEPNPYTQHTA